MLAVFLNDDEDSYTPVWRNGRVLARPTRIEVVKIDLADAERMDQVHDFLSDMPLWLRNHPKRVEIVGRPGKAEVVADVMRNVHPDASVRTKLLV